jgi:putative colanic acid biosynthesis glycosyltransferase WcaI
VAVITSNFWPEQTGSSQTVGEFADYLAKNGLQVRVVTSMPYYPQWRIWPEYRGVLYRAETGAGMSVFRSWHWVTPKPGTLTRLAHEASLTLFALPNMIRALRRARVAYVVSPALTFAVAGLVLAWVMGVRRILIVKDVMPDAAVELGMLRSPVLIALSRRLARLAYALADEIQTLGDGMRRRIAQACRHPDKIRIVPDTVDVRELTPVGQDRNEFRRQFVPAGVFSVLHTGNMGKKQDLGVLLRAADRLREDSGVRFYVVGDGAEKEDFLRQCAALGLNNVSYYPLQPRWMVPHMLSGADAVIVSQVAEIVDIVVPSKLITAMACGAMILAVCSLDAETAKLVQAAGGGLAVAAGDDANVVEAIQGLRSGRVDIERHRARVRQFACEHFDRDCVYSAEFNRLAAEYQTRSDQVTVREPRLPTRSAEEVGR